MPPAADWLMTRLVELRECLCTALAERGAGEVCWCGFQAGAEPTWDACGECDTGCGAAFIRLADVFPYTTFPVPDDGTATCRTPIGYTLEITALRCVPQHDDGSLLDPAETFELVADEALDMFAMRYAVECCFSGKGDIHRMGPWLPLGPEGGCVGSVWTVYVGQD